MGSAHYDGGYSKTPIFQRPKLKAKPTIADSMPSADMVEEIIKLQKELGKHKEEKET